VELSYFETLQMINLSIDRLESVFEFWLSATFASIVASHLAGEKLTKVYAGMLTSIYLIFTFSVVVRSMAWSDALERYSKMLRTLRGDVSESPTLDLVSFSIWATIILGTLATVFFIWHAHTTNKTAGSVISSETKRD
jgi:hypothetical protein